MNNPYVAMTTIIETFKFVTGSVGGPDERKGELEKVRVRQYLQDIRQYCSIDDMKYYYILLHYKVVLYYVLFYYYIVL